MIFRRHYILHPDEAFGIGKGLVGLAIIARDNGAFIVGKPLQDCWHGI